MKRAPRTPGLCRRGALLPFALVLAGCDGSEPPASGPNVVLITLDSVRADLLGAYGNDPRFTDRSPSPRLDRLAEEGLLVEQAYATSSWTLPSHVSIFTGVPELVHSVEQDGHVIPEALAVLAEILQSRGYDTAGFYSGPYLDEAFGFSRGFDRYEACYGDALGRAMEDLRKARARLEAAEGKPGNELYDALTHHAAARRRVELESHRDRSSERVADAMIRELGERGDAPFFLFGHFFDPHYDYAPPEELRTTFDGDYPHPELGRDFIRNQEIATFQEQGRARVVDERGLQHLWAMYEAELAWVDSMIARVLDELDALGLADDTLVVVTSDHGDEFFEHGSIGHRSTLHEELVRVPLIVRYPEHFAPGTRIEEPVSLTEIAPTILRAAGLPQQDSPGAGLQAIAQGAPPGPVLGRIVSIRETTLELDGRSYAAAETRVRETFRGGPVKIYREVAWIQPTEAVHERLAAEAEEIRLDMLANEKLRWVRLDVSPDEEKLWTDFEDEEESMRLVRFREAYEELLARRVQPGRVEASDDVLTALSGLGYVEQEARIGALEGDELALYPPRPETGPVHDRQALRRTMWLEGVPYSEGIDSSEEER